MDCNDGKMTSNEWMLFNYEKKRIQPFVQNRYYCKCGHSVVILPREKKVLCSYCGHWVFKNEKDEFVYRLKEKLK